MNTDTKDVAGAKRRERSAIQKEIRAHLNDRSYDDSHEMLLPHEILPQPIGVGVIGVDNSHVDLTGAMAAGDDVIEEEERKHDEESQWAIPMNNAPDIRALRVGKVPVHQRVNMEPMKVGDMVCLTWLDDDGAEQIGVAQIICMGDTPRIHWWENNSNTALSGGYLPVFQSGRTGRRMYRAAAKRDDADTIWEDTLDVSHVVEYGDIFTNMARKKKKGQKNKGRAIQKRIKKRACWLERVDWKINNHDDQCACIIGQ